jgi:hypothetical protein
MQLHLANAAIEPSAVNVATDLPVFRSVFLDIPSRSTLVNQRLLRFGRKSLLDARNGKLIGSCAPHLAIFGGIHTSVAGSSQVAEKQTPTDSGQGTEIFA